MALGTKPKHGQGPINVFVPYEADASGNFTAVAKYNGDNGVIAQATDATREDAIAGVLAALTAAFPGGDLLASCPVTILPASDLKLSFG